MGFLKKSLRFIEKNINKFFIGTYLVSSSLFSYREYNLQNELLKINTKLDKINDK